MHKEIYKNEVKNIIQKNAEIPEIKDMTLLQEGIINDIWKIDCENTSYILRKGTINSKRLNVDRYSEYEIHKQAAELNIAPKIIWADLHEEYLLIEYLKYKPITQKELNKIEFNNLIEALLKLQSIKSKKVDTEQFNHIAQIKLLNKKTINSSVENKTEVALELYEELIENSELKTCHNDLHNNNIILINNKFMFIDWEYAGRNNPLLDILRFESIFNFTPKQLKTLLTTLATDNTEEVNKARTFFKCMESLNHD